jgi:tRNA threonylcarbamoyl adenosine modification protein (Sua5/YciO/YrdC/YwlC family)
MTRGRTYGIQVVQVHPVLPQPRLIARAARVLREGGVIAYPTDAAYALGCRVGEKPALERLHEIRKLDEKHNFTLVCRSLSEASTYAHIDDAVFPLLHAHTPGPYTFILAATKEVPRRLLHPKRKTIGIRIPDHPIPLSLIAELGEPLMSTTLILPGETEALRDPEEIRERLDREIDLLIDGGPGSSIPTTVIDLLGDTPRILRVGKGDVRAFA